MRRLLVHPALCWLLPLILVIWPILVSRLVRWVDWGPLSGLGAVVTNPRIGSSQRSHYYELDFYILSDGSVDVLDKSCISCPPLMPIDNSATFVASYSYAQPSPSEYGLVFASLLVVRSTHAFEWDVAPPPMSAQQLVSLAQQRVSPRGEWPSYLPPESSVEPYYSLDTAAYGGLPTTLQGSAQHLQIRPLYVAADLVYALVLVWWPVTLRYAPRVWPKPNGSRCPSCGYELAGLASPVCPECGSVLPAPAARV